MLARRAVSAEGNAAAALRLAQSARSIIVLTRGTWGPPVLPGEAAPRAGNSRAAKRLSGRGGLGAAPAVPSA
ncbi:unnamed protein product, partial [Nesidiocoris tenuis]